VWTLYLLFAFIPPVKAVPTKDLFPDIPFKLFSSFVQNNFSSEITLATVLTILFSLTNNVDILNLHARAKNPRLQDEYSVPVNGWIRALSTAIKAHLDAKIGLRNMEDTQLFNASDNQQHLSSSMQISNISRKLDEMITILDLDPYKRNSSTMQLLKPISTSEIEPVLLICPARLTCSTHHKNCIGRAIHVLTRERDRTQVTLLKGIKLYENASIVAGSCTNCKAIYYADHKSVTASSDAPRDPQLSPKDKLFYNNAKYVKIGQSIWADRTFTNMIVNSVYHFHASTAAYTEFWNYTFSNGAENIYSPISRWQVWKAFIEETVRQISVSMNTFLQVPDNISTEAVTKEAYEQLGQNGLIGQSLDHSCNECTHPYKATADFITPADDAAVVGIDENRAVPPLQQNAENTELQNIDNNTMETGNSVEPDVKMVVIDGIVMGPTHCAYEDCSVKLANARTGVFYNYFVAPRFYCVETLCAPCGVVIAWTKFAKSEGASQIMDFLEDIYPTPESRPSYVCIDKACVVLKHLIRSRNWNMWKATTRFIVDSYHYINHRVGDYLCRTYCNPSPLNGSAPNLVVVEREINGNPHYKRAFNTQACEQLNAWLGGFQGILNRMSVDNFNWTTHALLYIHTQRVIQKQNKKNNQIQNEQPVQMGQPPYDDEVEIDGIEIDRVD
ncbi:hypothetical protein BDQ17DRAFT_1252964, partial [Cyathus striatus]